MKKRMLSIILAVFMIASMIPVGVMTASAAESDTYLEGDGSKENPYQIWTLDQLNNLADEVNNGDGKAGEYYVLCADIGDAENGFTNVIGRNTNDGSKGFKGHFDGKGHTVTLNINMPTQTLLVGPRSVGLFGFINSGAVICNVNTVGSVLGGSEVAGICGFVHEGIVYNCSNSATVTADDIPGRAGGICGFTNPGGTISNCSNSGNVSCTNVKSGASSAGGICGDNNNGRILNCYSSAKVTAHDHSLGGICGDVGGTINNCYYNKDLFNGKAGGGVGLTTAQMKAVAGTTNEEWTEGEGKALVDLLNGYREGEGEAAAYPSNFKEWVVENGEYPSLYAEIKGEGTKAYPFIIEKLYQLEKFADEVNGGDDKAGEYYVLSADIGTFKKVIGDCSHKFQGYFDGKGHTVTLDINVTGVDTAGMFGAIGSSAVICNVNTAGSVTADGDDDLYVGAICGYSDGTITNCYNIATVSGTTAGGICGYSDGTINNCYNSGTVSGTTAGGISGYDGATVNNCYYDSTDYSGNDVGIGLTAEQMQGATGTENALVDKLNLFIANNPDEFAGASVWDVKTGEYPHFAPFAAVKLTDTVYGTATDCYAVIGTGYDLVWENGTAPAEMIFTNGLISTSAATPAGTYTFSLNSTAYTSSSYTFIVDPILINAPTDGVVNYVYNGKSQTYIPENFDENTMSITGNIWTNVGTYTATVSLKDADNYRWADGSTEPITFTWTISKADCDEKIADFYRVASRIVLPSGPEGVVYSTDASGVTIDGNTVTFSGDAPNEVTVKVSSDYYNDYTFKITKHKGNTFSTGKYRFFGSVIFDERMEINGMVEFVLEDTACVKANKGVFLTTGNTLIVSGTGELSAKGDVGAAGIGSDVRHKAGNLIVNGGKITAIGGFGAKGIGGFGGNDGEFIQNGGTVEAINGEGYVHTHTFESGYTFDENRHWHKCTCEDENCKSLVSGFGEHTFDDGVVDGMVTTYTCSVCGYQKTVLSTDINGDGKVDATDLALLKIAVLSGYDHLGKFDCNGDGNFDILDIIRLKKALANTDSPIDKPESEQQSKQPATELASIIDKKKSSDIWQ